MFWPFRFALATFWFIGWLFSSGSWCLSFRCTRILWHTCRCPSVALRVWINDKNNSLPQLNPTSLVDVLAFNAIPHRQLIDVGLDVVVGYDSRQPNFFLAVVIPLRFFAFPANKYSQRSLTCHRCRLSPTLAI